MSLSPAFLRARQRLDDRASPPEPEAHDDVFDLIAPPPEEAPKASTESPSEPVLNPASVLRPEPVHPEPAAASETLETNETPQALAPPEVPPEGRNVHPVGMMDLSRLSIDNDGRLYWDGKPVEVRRRIMLSRTQAIGLAVIGGFVIVGALSAAIQATAAARDWACRLGWSTSYCTLPDAGPSKPAVRPDIPA
jgi:hypothetical protein